MIRVCRAFLSVYCSGHLLGRFSFMWCFIVFLWFTSELRVRLAPLNRFKPSSKIFYWPFQGGTSFVDLLCFCSVLCLLCFVRVCLYVLCGHLLGKGWPLGSRLWCLLWVCHFPIGILGQVWYLIVSIPDLCNLTYFSHVMSWVRCGAWMYRFLIFVSFLSFIGRLWAKSKISHFPLSRPFSCANNSEYREEVY